MNAGLPGAGIGGLFYLASSLMIPVRSVWRRLRGLPDEVRLAQHLRLLGMVSGILAGLWVAGWLLSFVAPHSLWAPDVTGSGGSPVVRRNVLPAATLGIGIATMLVVLGAVEVARLIERRTRATEPPSGL